MQAAISGPPRSARRFGGLAKRIASATRKSRGSKCTLDHGPWVQAIVRHRRGHPSAGRQSAHERPLAVFAMLEDQPPGSGSAFRLDGTLVGVGLGGRLSGNVGPTSTVADGIGEAASCKAHEWSLPRSPMLGARWLHDAALQRANRWLVPSLQPSGRLVALHRHRQWHSERFTSAGFGANGHR